MLDNIVKNLVSQILNYIVPLHKQGHSCSKEQVKNTVAIRDFPTNSVVAPFHHPIQPSILDNIVAKSVFLDINLYCAAAQNKVIFVHVKLAKNTIKVRD